jgi:hypothetical protein
MVVLEVLLVRDVGVVDEDDGVVEVGVTMADVVSLVSVVAVVCVVGVLFDVVVKVDVRVVSEVIVVELEAAAVGVVSAGVVVVAPVPTCRLWNMPSMIGFVACTDATRANRESVSLAEKCILRRGGREEGGSGC